LILNLIRDDIESRNCEIIVKGGDIIPFGSDISPRRVEIIAKRDDIIPLGIGFNLQRTDMGAFRRKILRGRLNVYAGRCGIRGPWVKIRLYKIGFTHSI
jgi:hypothetical protein